jgi:very-short-patch-repair endonuclease
VITRRQLLALGFTSDAVKARLANGRLYPIWPGVYAVDRPDLTQEGRFHAAVLACGEGAVLSHISAALLWGIVKVFPRVIEISVPPARTPRRRGINVHRRKTVAATTRKSIPVTSPTQTLLDLAHALNAEQYERAVNQAVNGDLVDPEELRAELEKMPPQPGIRPLKRLLDRDTYVVTDTELEQRFVPIARRAGFPKPETQVQLGSRRVDFFFRELGIVVEANSLRYHRTASQQANDTRRTQEHLASGLLPVPFTHWQITYDAKYVESTLRAVRARPAPVDPPPSRSSTKRPNFSPVMER